jgi:hypothetical protein
MDVFGRHEATGPHHHLDAQEFVRRFAAGEHESHRLAGHGVLDDVASSDHGHLLTRRSGRKAAKGEQIAESRRLGLDDPARLHAKMDALKERV